MEEVCLLKAGHDVVVSCRSIGNSGWVGLADPLTLLLSAVCHNRYGQSLAEDLPEADLVMGFQAYGNLPDALAERLGLPAPAATSSQQQQ